MSFVSSGVHLGPIRQTRSHARALVRPSPVTMSASLRGTTDYRNPKALLFNSAGFVGTGPKEYLYDRFLPSRTAVNIGNSSTTQTVSFSVWNTSRSESLTITGYTQSDATSGVTFNSLGLVIPPFSEANLIFEVSAQGSETVDTLMSLTFNPSAHKGEFRFAGSRVAGFSLYPEVPVNETWTWVTDVLRSNDGSEQRISVGTGSPKVETSFTSVLTTQSAISDIRAKMQTGQGRMWLPEFQYAVRIEADAAKASTSLAFSTMTSDIRAGDAVMIVDGATTIDAAVASVTPNSAELSEALPVDVPEGAIIMGGSTALMSDNLKLERYKRSDFAKMNIRAELTRVRDTFANPLAPSLLTYLDGYLLLEREPTVDSTETDSVRLGSEDVGTRYGKRDIRTDWVSPRLTKSAKFHIDRTLPYEIHYWRKVMGELRGSQGVALLSTFRPDLQLAGNFQPNNNVVVVSGVEFAERYFGLDAYVAIEIVTANFTFRSLIDFVTVGNAASEITLIDTAPYIGSADEIKRISYLIPWRIADDKANIKHYHNHSELKINLVSAEL